MDAVTGRTLLRPSPLARLEPDDLRSCPTASCAVVYFGPGQVFEQEDVAVRVFQKIPTAARTVCHCFDISENNIGAEIEASQEEVRALVQRCRVSLLTAGGSEPLPLIARGRAAGRDRRRRRLG
jgi:hypothetical protein